MDNVPGRQSEQDKLVDIGGMRVAVAKDKPNTTDRVTGTLNRQIFQDRVGLGRR